MASQESLPLRRLKEFQPLNRLTDDQLVVLASRAERRTHGPGQRVLERGVRDGLDYFLVTGKVELESVDGRKSVIEAETDQALNPIARLQPRMYDVTAVKPCEFLVVEQDVLNQLLRSAPVAQVEMDSGESHGGESEEHHLLMEFYAELRSNQLKLPSVPDVAWKVRRLVDRDDSTADEVATAVSADPAMAAKLVRACNSPLYRGFSDVRNVRETVVRLGMRTTRQLVTVFSMREVFKSRHPSLQKEMEKLWRHSREVAALCWVLADHATRLNPEEALLAGLLHDIGVVPVLVQAEHHVNLFADDTNLKNAISELRADVGTAVLGSWSFPPAFVEAVRHAEDWAYESREAEPQLVDVVIVAQLHAMIGSSQNEGLPAFDEVPAYRRLGNLELNASRSLELLTEARARVDEVQQLLSIR
ncbi:MULTISPECIES: HDOD domain-containing protein [Marinobacter]|uniref:HDOD domain-containing protein n=1 Tax=Marinobacter xiaoshiensis TaxID=3073652 RepID=A0ABU2HLH9_9GAMM|nr:MULTISPECIES: HDOD domain-containing protein [unclassified Marinobacter]MBK1872950.1 HDOD domain-containing protein [Marinobacter sp. 1-3A]MBK1887028.1 HDOD domain-containing protein [Marinobacter sp. DY40_1A1]MDS1311917.1 HDOD domain-containing protein [Marinobacter sp. F60267]